MKVSICLGGAFLIALTACSSGQKSFNTMTEDEIFAYNLDRPVEQQVICEKRRQSASRIRNNVCMTVQEMATERDRGYSKLQVLNHPTYHEPMNRAHR